MALFKEDVQFICVFDGDATPDETIELTIC